MTDGKDQLAQIVHELRNPLNSISINAELAKLQIQKQQDPAAILLSIDRIMQECKRCARMLDDLSNPS